MGRAWGLKGPGGLRSPQCLRGPPHAPSLRLTPALCPPGPRMVGDGHHLCRGGALDHPGSAPAPGGLYLPGPRLPEPLTPPPDSDPWPVRGPHVTPSCEGGAAAGGHPRARGWGGEAQLPPLLPLPGDPSPQQPGRPKVSGLRIDSIPQPGAGRGGREGFGSIRPVL